MGTIAVVYFSRGTLPTQKAGEKGHLAGGPRASRDTGAQGLAWRLLLIFHFRRQVPDHQRGVRPPWGARCVARGLRGAECVRGAESPGVGGRIRARQAMDKGNHPKNRKKYKT